MNKSIILVGVGGQGTILASKLLTIGLMEAGYDVKMSEIHGMAQRGGSVSSQVRYGDQVYSPVIELGGADMMVAFEKMEGLRWLEYLKPDGKAIINNHQINSMPILNGKADYPDNIETLLTELVNATFIDAANMAESLGNSKVMNIILLGTVIKTMQLETINWERIIAENVKSQFIDLNCHALKLGMAQV